MFKKLHNLNEKLYDLQRRLEKRAQHYIKGHSDVILFKLILITVATNRECVFNLYLTILTHLLKK